MTSLKVLVAVSVASGFFFSGNAFACHNGGATGHARVPHVQGQHSQAAAPQQQGKKVAGVINRIAGKKVTVTHNGAKGKQTISATIDNNTQVLKGDKLASVSDLQENQAVIVQFAANSDEAISIDIVPAI